MKRNPLIFLITLTLYITNTYGTGYKILLFKNKKSLDLISVTLRAKQLNVANVAPTLGAAANFALFTTTGAVGNTGISKITGDIGTGLGAITGFTTSRLIGSSHINDAVTTQSSNDLMAAYNQLVATTPTATHAPVFGNGETLFAGVYSLGGAASLTGLLIIDAQRNPNAIFIIKVGGAFTTGAGATVVLANGATASNVFWVAEGAVAMAAATNMKGTVIANNGAISMAAGGTLEGRMFSTSGAVATDSDFIYLPGNYDLTWLGKIDNNWSNPANWLANTVPGSTDKAFIGFAIPFNNYPNISASAGVVNVGSIAFGAMANKFAGVAVDIGGTLNVLGAITYQSDARSGLGYVCLLSGLGTVNVDSIIVIANSILTTQPYTQAFASSVNKLNINTIITLTSTLTGNDKSDVAFNITGGTTLNKGVLKTTNDNGSTSTFAINPASTVTATLQIINNRLLSGLSLTGINIVNFENQGATVDYSGPAQTVYTDVGFSGLSSGISYQNIKFSGTGIKSLSTGNLNVAGDFTNLLSNDVGNNIGLLVNMVNFNGTVQSLVGGFGNGVIFNNTTFSGGGTKTMSSGLFSVISTGALTMGANTILATGAGLLTLNSDANGSARVAAIPSGSSISGSVNVNRFITGGSLTYRGYRLLSSPVAHPSSPGNYDLSYLKGSGTYLTGAAGGGFDATGNPTIYLYNEALTPNNSSFTSGNFRAVTAINNTNSYTLGTADGNFNMPIGNGYLFFFRGNNGTATSTIPNDIIFSMLGTLNQGQYAVNNWYTAPPTSLLAYTGTGNSINSAVRGFNLVGNPYPSSIDWNTAYSGTPSSGIYAPNTDQTIYIYNAVNKNYSAYLNTGPGTGMAAGSPGGSNIIPSGQGFFVRATGANAQIIFHEDAKVSTQPAFLMLNTAANTLSVTDRHIRLQLAKDSVNIDESVLVFKKNTSANFVVGEDARYFKGTGTVSLSNVSANNVALAINQLPFTNAKQSIALKIGINTSGAYRLNMPEATNISKQYDIWLMDNYLKDSLKYMTKK
jgi:hypothetical protein